MISTIELGYDDEPFFGFVGRVVRRLRRRSRSAFAEWAFGTEICTPHFEFPHRLDFVASRLTSRVGLTSLDIVNRMTMLPAVSPFLEPERVSRIVGAMQASGTPAVSKVMWRQRFGLISDCALRFCHRCRRDDLKEFPHAWWRRVHQIPGVVCCPIHGDPLSISQFSASGRWLHEYVLIEDAVEVAVAPRPDALDLFIAEQMRWLLQRPHIALREAYAFRGVFRERLQAMGFIKGARLSRRDFCEAFHGQRTEAQWRERGVQFDPQDYGCWPARVAQSYRNQHTPILFIALMKFLDLNVESAIARANDPHAAKSSFRCYSPSDSAKEEMIVRLWNDSTRRFWWIVRSTGLTSAGLLREARRLNLPIPRRAHRGESRLMRRRRASRRRIWLDPRTEPSARKRAGNWLGVWDRAWLSSRLPARKQTRVGIDWNARQKELLARLPYAVARIKARRPFRRVVFKPLAQNVGSGKSLGEALRHMPILKRAIDAAVETREDFCLRRILSLRKLHPHWPAWMVRQASSVNRDERDPKVMTAMGYRLRGGVWYSTGGPNPSGFPGLKAK